MSKTSQSFGTASAASLVFLTMNITSNILTSEKLLFYLPWFVAPMISAIAADYVLNKSSNKFVQKNADKISGAILGSMFFIFSFPMFAMVFLEFYVYNDVFSYDVIHSSANILGNVWLMTIIPGAVSGMIGTVFAKKKFSERM